jgi:acetyl esterase/lipase
LLATEHIASASLKDEYMNRQNVRLVLALALPAICLAQGIAQSDPQQTSAAASAQWKWTPIAAPDQDQAIPLSTSEVSAQQAEEWVMYHGQRSVYNVPIATLLPVLPDPGKATGAAVIVAPGGGFLYLEYDSEGHEVARWLANHGIAAFVLKYRTKEIPRDPQAAQQAVYDLVKRVTADERAVPQTPPMTLEDAKAAVRLVRLRAKEWGIDPARIGFTGFSAGAITTLSIGLTPDKTARPDFIAPIYGPMDAIDVPSDAPPMFVALASDDAVFAKGKSMGLIDSWRKAGRPIEAHLYVRGGHGFGMRYVSASTSLWIDEFYAWMKDMHLLDAAH